MNNWFYVNRNGFTHCISQKKIEQCFRGTCLKEFLHHAGVGASGQALCIAVCLVKVSL